MEDVKGPPVIEVVLPTYVTAPSEEERYISLYLLHFHIQILSLDSDDNGFVLNWIQSWKKY